MDMEYLTQQIKILIIVYKKFFLAKVNNKSVKNILYKPTWFNEHEFELNGIFDYKCKKVSGQNNLIVYEVQDCLK